MSTLQSARATYPQKPEKWFKRNRLLTSIIPILICGLGLALVTLDHTPDAHLIGEVKHPGYESSPAQWQVEASSNKEWGDYWTKYWPLPILSFALMFGLVFGYITYLEKEVKEGTWKVIAVVWLVGILMIVLPFYHMTSGGAYETVLTPTEYESVKGNLDALFPL